MKKNNNNSLLLTIMGGAIFCFVFLGMAFIFTNNTKVMKGNTSSSNQQIINNDEISLGDVSCGAGQGADSSATTGCSNCAAGYYSPANDNACHQCSAGTYSAAGARECSQCNGSKQYSGAGATSCSTCGEGKIANSNHTGCVNASTTCGGGQVPSSDGATCVNCPAGTYSPAGSNTCSNCNGTMQYSHAGAASCSTCLTGTKPNSNHTDCVDDPTVTVYCGAGQGADSSATTGCSNCAAGYYSLANDNTCHPCAGEKSYSGVGAASCSTCPTGQKANSNHTGCVDDTSSECPAGQYLSSTSSTGCASCPPGSYCTGGSSQPVSCSAGTYSSAGARECSQCNKSDQYSGAGATSCSTCPTGQKANSTHTGCVDENVSCASIATSSACTARSDCEWDYTNYCHDKPKSCASLATVGECTARSDCEWDYTNYCHDKATTLLSLTGGGTAYVTPDTCKTFHFSAKGENGKGVDVTWNISGSHYTASCPNGTTCTVSVCGWTCPPAKATVTVTASANGVSKSGSITINSYTKWSKTAWTNVPKSGDQPYIYNSTSLDNDVCYGYSDPYVENGVTKYKSRYTRCCGIGGDTPPAPTPSACYTDDNGGYHWTNSPDSSWKKVAGISKEADCKETEDDACYKNIQTGQYQWGKYAKTTGYTLITSITDSALCQEPTVEEDDACYRKDDNYVWSKTAPEGYTKVDGVTKPEDCALEETPACYVIDSTGDWIWGKYDKVTGYIKLQHDDGTLLEQSECVKPNNEACYVNSEGRYDWGDYSDNPDYTIIPSITEMSQCKSDVPVPATGISLSKLVYIFMAILMACGVGFIYYSSVVKKNS